LVKKGVVVRRWSEIGAIEGIESLRAKLHVEGFRNPLNRVVFEYGHVEVYEAWPDNNIPAVGLKQVGAVDLAVRCR
jgi:hypothetical protein